MPPMRCIAALLLASLAVSVAPGRAAAQQDYFTEQTTKPLTYRVDGQRSPKNKLVLSGMAAGTLLFGGLGLYFHLESRDAANDVTAFAGEPTNLIYTPGLDQRRIDADTNKTRATVLYGLGGAALITTIVTYIVTSPPDELREYESSGDSRVATPYVVPVEGGAMMGGTVRF